MKHTGDLDTTSLEELFAMLSKESASGTLLLTSPDGEKRITLSGGEIILLSNQAASRIRIGDLLVARGKITDDQLRETLFQQRKEKKRKLLGELLISKGLVTKQDVQMVVRFQLEEEICDLFSWKDVAYDFESGRKVATEQVEKADRFQSPDTSLTRLTADPEAVIKEATRRADEVKELSHRLSSPYLCFKLSDVGIERAKDCGPGTKVLLRLIRQGRTLETIVKQSYQGRLAVYQNVVRLLDDGWVLPYPSSELRYLASEHRAQGRYADALHIYRRLLENSSTDKDRIELERLIDDTTDAILRSKMSGEHPEGFDPFRHRELAQKYFRRRRVRRILLVGLLLAAMAFGISAYMSRDPRVSPSSRYLAALHDSEKALADNRYEDAIKIWKDFFDSLPDKNSNFAKLVRDKYGRLSTAYKRHIETLCAQAGMLTKDGKFDESKELYEKILKEYPNNGMIDEIKQSIAGMDARRKEMQQELTSKSLKTALKKGRDLEAQRRFQAAQDEYKRLIEDAASMPEVVNEAKAGLARLGVIAGRAKKRYEAGLQLVKEGSAAEAIGVLDGVQTEWPELQWSQLARERSLELRMKQDHLREKIGIARGAEARGAVTQAVATLERIVREYKEFKEARELQARIDKLSGRLRSAEQLYEQAQKADKAKDRDKAEDAYTILLRRHYRFLTARKASIPVRLSSIPQGAQVIHNDRILGRTPLRAALAVDGVHKLSFRLAGFATEERVIRKVAPEHLSIRISLDRAALRVQDLAGPAMAPVLCHDGRVYVSAGIKLQAWETAAAACLWTVGPLLDDTKTSRPSSDGTKRPIFVDDKSWWNLRCPPVAVDGSHLLVPTRAGKVLRVNTSDGKFTPLFDIPLESVGPVVTAGGVSLAGKSRVAVVCADGTLAVFDPAKPGSPVWSDAIDPAPYPTRKPVAGALPGGSGGVVTVSRGGLIRCWGLISGSLQWKLNLNTLVGASRMQKGDGKAGDLCAFITEDGSVVLVDLSRGKMVWELDAPGFGDEAGSVTVSDLGICVITRGGKCRLYPMATSNTAPKKLWEQSIGGSGPDPLVLPEIVFTASGSGLLTALSRKDGKLVWRYSCEAKPTHLATDGKFLYIVTAGGKLIVFRASK